MSVNPTGGQNPYNPFGGSSQEPGASTPSLGNSPFSQVMREVEQNVQQEENTQKKENRDKQQEEEAKAFNPDAPGAGPAGGTGDI